MNVLTIDEPILSYLLWTKLSTLLKLKNKR